MQDHPINKAIQKINYIIRLIFKSQGNQRNDANVTGGQIPPSVSAEAVKIMKGVAGDSNGF